MYKPGNVSLNFITDIINLFTRKNNFKLTLLDVILLQDSSTMVPNYFVREFKNYNNIENIEKITMTYARKKNFKM